MGPGASSEAPLGPKLEVGSESVPGSRKKSTPVKKVFAPEREREDGREQGG